jgi:hypothetical protein
MIKVAVDIVVVGAVWTTWVVPQLMAPSAVIDDCHLTVDQLPCDGRSLILGSCRVSIR